MKPIDRKEIEAWPSLGPIALDPKRVLKLLEERDAWKELAEKAQQLIKERDTARALAVEEAARVAAVNRVDWIATSIRALAYLPSTLVAVEKEEWETLKRIADDEEQRDEQMKKERDALIQGSNEWMREVLGDSYSRLWGPSLEAFGRGVDDLRTQLAAAQAEAKALASSYQAEMDVHTETQAKSEKRRRALEVVRVELVYMKLSHEPIGSAGMRILGRVLDRIDAALKDTPTEAPKGEKP